ncbi:MAG: type II toxin-antitoxin system Phd/YefM family antitoxin [Gammaproteobacteria bacterium]|uniref:type II toxin-antitoxin system Phd/YefM family antitoxin n=1 Tax=Rhodoferax sp. TaxID=50421 RepID=UPI001816D806|nr:type II toxin-antitoxin system Phd/YefM family antitoxin [Rhodoferax sp.]MBU3897669.1 type II toxin-antitoxin system Phd/YefM family antitoxin [Gammaproteobacteria bacterium]MBA3056308.1 type II toxin-antitoxin system Phd/YefM family antitoxin [Rhodoferax sp.]MBU3998578.1 type II toxin-antitoxin system Phd/YefM family antitoxin [Gammaproteobacteria bacterium]MBU4080045.1 type II toxin-antitoxin system Phd/YefM family antitoxin [Gammaproteobacteria bacterium]MBU4112164.1 type II toxin-antito
MIHQHPTDIGAGAFKSQCLKLLDAVALNRAPLVITKRGKAVAKLIPMPDAVDLFGAMSGSVLFEGDIISPLDNDWSAAR